LAIVLSPSVDWGCRLKIVRWHPSRGAAILLIVTSVFIAFTVLFLFGLPPVINDIQQLLTRLPEEARNFAERISHIPFLERIDESRIQEYSAKVIAAIPGFIGSIADAIASIAGIAILTAYLILEGEAVFSWCLALLPPEKRERLKPVFISAAERMRKWLVGQALLMLILGVSSIIVFGALGIRYFYMLGVFAGLANFIPFLGPILTVVLAGLVAAFDSWGKLIGVLIFYFVYQQVENAFLTPRIMKLQVHLSASAVLIALLVGAELAGVPGAMMAVPTAVLASTLINSFVIEKHAPK
jgi:predicted PurR-regulated permease PerM